MPCRHLKHLVIIHNDQLNTCSPDWSRTKHLEVKASCQFQEPQVLWKRESHWMLAPVASLNQPQVGAATFAPSSQEVPVCPPVLMTACAPQ